MIEENWTKREHCLTNHIRLTGATVDVFVAYRKGTYEPIWETRVVELVAVTTRWPVNEDEGEATLRVALWCRRPDQHPFNTLEKRPEQLREIPDWLEDLVLRASPRDVDYPDMKPYAGMK